ncbi:MAG: hypothetical protein KW806_02100, partial [Candidatus Yanofskybacteria bacterium]|nr:hypothetical protein [Candidatus Yanofskybacteria bacterium]
GLVLQPRTVALRVISPVPSPIFLGATVAPTPKPSLSANTQARITVPFIGKKGTPTPTPASKSIVPAADTAFIRNIVLGVLRDTPAARPGSSPTLAAFNALLDDFSAIKSKVNRNVIDGGSITYNYAPPTTVGTTVTEFRGSSVTVTGAITGAATFGSGLTDCTGVSQALQWTSSGAFSCATITSGGGGGSSSSNIEIRELGVFDDTSVASLSFEPGHFALSASNSQDVIVRLDWGSGGPASLSENETVTGIWNFSNGASTGANFELTTGRLGINAGALTNTSLEVGGAASLSGAFTQTGATASNSFAGSLNVLRGITVTNSVTAATLNITGTSILTGLTTFNGGATVSTNFELTTGRLGINAGALTDTSLEVGGAASISGNITQGGASSFTTGTGTVTLNGATTAALTFTNTGLGTFNGGVSVSTNFEITGAKFFGLNSGAVTNSTFEIGDSATTTGVIASLSGTGLTTGSFIQLTVRASTSAVNNVLTVRDTNGVVVASLGNSGRLALRNQIFTHAGGSAGCTGSNAPTSGCIDYAESFPTIDLSLQAGEIVTLDHNGTNVVRANHKDGVIGIVSTNPATLITGSGFKWGAAANEPIPGFVPIALAGRVPVKITSENGVIVSGDRLTVSATQPGYAMKATSSGMTIGIVMESIDANTVLVFVNNTYWMPGTEAGTDVTVTPEEQGVIQKLVAQIGSLFNIFFDNGIVRTVKGIFQSVELQTGATIYDRITGQPYCLGIENGATVTRPGKCDDAVLPSVQPLSGGGTTEPAATPSASPEASSEPIAQPEPSSAPDAPALENAPPDISFVAPAE